VVAEAPVVPAASDRLEMHPASETGALAGAAGAAGNMESPAGAAGDTGPPLGSARAIDDSRAVAGEAEPSAAPRPAAPASDLAPSGDASALVGVSGSPRPASPSVATTAADPTAERVLRELLALDLCHLTPLEALNRLAALQQRGREAPP
jgi:hypothetical protein